METQSAKQSKLRPRARGLSKSVTTPRRGQKGRESPQGQPEKPALRNAVDVHVARELYWNLPSGS